MSKQKIGISVDEDLVTELDALVEESEDMAVSRSEVAEAIFTAFMSGVDESERSKRIRQLVIRRRKGNL